MGSEENTAGTDLSLKIAGNEASMKNVKSMNTIATVATMVLVCVLGVFLYYHEVAAQQDKATLAKTLSESNGIVAKALEQSNKTMTEALKELTIEQRRSTSAMKEIACLSDPAMKNRPDARDFCKRISGADR